MTPEERTFKIEHKGKNYLIQLRSDKGQFLTEDESQGIINSFNANDFTIETLYETINGLKREGEDVSKQNKVYLALLLIVSIYELMSFML